MKKSSRYPNGILQRWLSRPINLRGKLILGNLVITFLAILGMGYYIYYRTQESNTFLTTQLTQSVRQKAEGVLISSSGEQAELLNSFFASVSKDITGIGKTIGNLFSQEALLNSGGYWDASHLLSRLPTGSWDNPNSEESSVFIPANLELTPELISELNTLKHSESSIPPILEENPDIIAIYFGGVFKETVYYPNIDLASVVPPDFDVTGRPWYVAAELENNAAKTVVWSVPYEDAALHGLVVTSSLPVFDDTGRFRGVAAMDIQLNRISDIVSNIHLGNSGYAFLMDKDRRLIALPKSGYTDFGLNIDSTPLGEILDKSNFPNLTADFSELINKIPTAQNDITTITLSGIERFVVFQPIPEVEYSLVIVTPSEELLAEATLAQQQIAQSTRNTIVISVVLIVIILLGTSLATFVFGNLLTRPLRVLSQKASEITSGNLDVNFEVPVRDEFGVLAETLNKMATTIKEFIHSLEERVADRTSALQNSLKKEELRAKQFEAITKVARAATMEQNTSALLEQVCRLISEHFNFYHVGIFLNDANNQYAILSAANSRGGRKMMERRHHLRIGEQGIVGYVTASGMSRIAVDVGKDAVFFDNPDLPDTRSEMALPLKTGTIVIGALDVQSIEANAFSTNDVEVLSTLADQVSLAIQNSRLFEQTRKSLTEVEALYRRYVREAWGRIPEEQGLTGYRYTPQGVEPIAKNTELDHSGNGRKPKEQNASNVRPFVEVPIMLRGERLGTLKVETPMTGYFKPDQLDLIKAVAERVALSAENARLFEETSRRAQRERLVSEITNKIRSSNNPQEMIRTAIDELRHALGVSRVEVIPQNNVPRMDA